MGAEHARGAEAAPRAHQRTDVRTNARLEMPLPGLVGYEGWW